MGANIVKRNWPRNSALPPFALPQTRPHLPDPLGSRPTALPIRLGQSRGACRRCVGLFSREKSRRVGNWTLGTPGCPCCQSWGVGSREEGCG